MVDILDFYEQNLLQNEKSIADQLTYLSEQIVLYQDEQVINDYMHPDDKIQAVLTHYQKATDKNNPNHKAYKIHNLLLGKLSSGASSYNYLANKKYSQMD